MNDIEWPVHTNTFVSHDPPGQTFGMSPPTAKIWSSNSREQTLADLHHQKGPASRGYVCNFLEIIDHEIPKKPPSLKMTPQTFTTRV